MLAVAATVTAYWIANSALIGVATSARHGSDIVIAICEQVSSNSAVLFLAIAAALAGMAASAKSTPELIVLMIIPLAAFELRLNVQRRPNTNNEARVGIHAS